ncbi:MAG TPA: hypothetical protein VJZ76_24535 [Thermoanaerobaculia bacterium]|nr:hypothetical protein [Thermoanaerobaculia bacterium]
MTIQVELPEDRESETAPEVDETRINEVADELNREAADVLEYQVIP